MELSVEVFKPDYIDKVVSVNEYRERYKDGITYQAVQYAIRNDKVDYMQISPRLKVIVLTEKTLAYQPNSSPKRDIRKALKKGFHGIPPR